MTYFPLHQTTCFFIPLVAPCKPLLLRLDLKSEYETSEEISTIMNLIVPPAFDLFECEEIITKVPVYAVERMEAMKRVGFKKSTKLLVGTIDGYAYKDYWTINR